jgi:ABC-2 type transport system ATP-binding protein
MVAGLLKPDHRAISIFGIDARSAPVAAKRVTAWLPDEPMIYDKMSSLEYLEFVAGLWSVDFRIAMERADTLLHLLHLWDHRNERCGEVRHETKDCARRGSGSRSKTTDS